MVEFQKLSSFFFKFLESDARFIGDFYYDLHIHTTASDSFIKPDFLKNFVKNKRYLLSVTDHNEIRGAVELYEKGINVVPGIEIGCEDGFEMLVYFNEMQDLEDFYRREVEGYKNLKRMAKTHRTIYEYLDTLQGINYHKSIPHICGVVQKNFIHNKPYIYDIIQKVDSIETHNHALPMVRNLQAAELREQFNLTATFGSDAHIIREAIAFYKYANMASVGVGDTVMNYLFKIGSISGIGQKHLIHMLKNTLL